MSQAKVELSEKERACLEHLRQAREQGKSFSQYCREQDLSHNQWYWVKRELVRKGVIAGKGKENGNAKGQGAKPAGFVPVRLSPPAAAVVCRVSHPSGWVMECGSFPQAQWLAALLSGEAA
jgi:hypothetical protein